MDAETSESTNCVSLSSRDAMIRHWVPPSDGTTIWAKNLFFTATQSTGTPTSFTCTSATPRRSGLEHPPLAPNSPDSFLPQNVTSRFPSTVLSVSAPRYEIPRVFALVATCGRGPTFMLALEITIGASVSLIMVSKTTSAYPFVKKASRDSDSPDASLRSTLTPFTPERCDTSKSSSIEIP